MYNDRWKLVSILFYYSLNIWLKNTYSERDDYGNSSINDEVMSWWPGGLKLSVDSKPTNGKFQCDVSELYELSKNI